MLEFSLGSEFEVEYEDQKIKFKYHFPTGDEYQECSFVSGGKVLWNTMKLAKYLIDEVEGCFIKVKTDKKSVFPWIKNEEKQEVTDPKKFFSLPLGELHIIVATTLGQDVEKKHRVTGVN